MNSKYLAGMLIVASPKLADSNFNRSVVLMIEHGETGAIGVVLNQPTMTPVTGAFRGLKGAIAASDPAVIFAGGPVSPQAIIALGHAASPDVMDFLEEAGGDLDGEPDRKPKQSMNYLFNDIYVVDIDNLGGNHLESLRVFLGYAGWGAGQLEDEIAAGAWFAVDSMVGDVFTLQPDSLWHDVLFRQGGSLAMVANYPLHPRLN
ncbi:MAG: YqgE/AlgH family protein [Actinobacteria bacterium]|nr:YqgE/AlgH family protein [Actinomycetota bacterium]MCL5886551.1 YqgE/AlgH family protein [Actinomycetota bacterium]